MLEIQKMSKIAGVKSIVQKKQEAAGAYCMVHERFMAAIVMVANQDDCLWVNYIGPCGRRVLQW